VCVLRFRSIGSDPALADMEEALSEAIITDVGQQPGLRIIERGQIDMPLGELDFSHSRHVDPETRARLGRIAGAEVVVIGSIQRSGNVMRAAARFVHVETGEVLDAARVEGPARTPLAVQDALAARVRELLPGLPRRLRP
jgi:TolB-like protein